MLEAPRQACEISAVSIMKIVSTVALNDPQRNVLRGAVPRAELVDKQCRTPEDIAAMLSHGCDVMLTFRMPGDLLARAPHLKWVQLLSAGADHALGGPLKSAEIAMTTSSGIHATPIAEYTIASMLAYAHKFHLIMRAQLRHEWLRSGQFMNTIDELRGRTLGIIGYGSIGRETARLATAFGMRVLGLKRDPANRRDPGWSPAGLGDPEGSIPEKFYGSDECEAILRESDYVSVTLPLTEHTRRFIGAREIAAMKPGAYIVNIGRGEVIDEAAMIDALRAGKIGGAGLDVFEKEPLPGESALWELENVILTPHMSGANRGYMDKACELFADNLRRFNAGQPLLNLVDRRLGY
jgi:phosphoglycerate dehydrogenase-like enzyme